MVDKLQVAAKIVAPGIALAVFLGASAFAAQLSAWLRLAGPSIWLDGAIVGLATFAAALVWWRVESTRVPTWRDWVRFSALVVALLVARLWEVGPGSLPRCFVDGTCHMTTNNLVAQDFYGPVAAVVGSLAGLVLHGRFGALAG